ncbi:unnamed protein product [Musa hybrid cultivar]
MQIDGCQFTYAQLAKITDTFVRIINRGGFGIDYYGELENGTQVVVKLWLQSSPQGAMEFLAEVITQFFLGLSQRNLVSLIGYCNDGNYLVLVYEFMPRGSLQEHLKGLDYLHWGCKPTIIHRDVKSSNILLGEHLEAKRADFGLSKTFLNQYGTHVFTMRVVGTPGYVDSQVHLIQWLSQRLDRGNIDEMLQGNHETSCV